jgi:2-polyprenyl-3-methyl-5-hydroxy-6-metoxy-1,4-benzoquinol methylase
MAGYKDYGYADASYSHIHKYILQPLLKILSKKDNRIILDIGCGNGWLCNHLIQLGYNTYGIDASKSGIAIANQTNPGRFFLQDISSNELPNELKGMLFNTIISTEVVEHLYSPREYFALCRNILEKAGGGELIVTTPYHGYLKNIALSLSGKMDNHFTVLWDGGHIKFWSKKTLYRILKEQGFTNMQFTGCGRLPYLWKSMMISSRV